MRMVVAAVAVVSLMALAGCKTSGTAAPETGKPSAATLVPAPLAYPAAGTRLRYEGTRSRGNDWTWDGVVSAKGDKTELVRGDGRTRSLYPGCLRHCNRVTHPITIVGYQKTVSPYNREDSHVHQGTL